MVTKEELQERAQLVRIYEAACQIQHATDEDIRFRLAIMKKLALEYGLRELRDKVIAGPGMPPRPPAPITAKNGPSGQPPNAEKARAAAPSQERKNANPR